MDTRLGDFYNEYLKTCAKNRHYKSSAFFTPTGVNHIHTMTESTFHPFSDVCTGTWAYDRTSDSGTSYWSLRGNPDVVMRAYVGMSGGYRWGLTIKAGDPDPNGIITGAESYKELTTLAINALGSRSRIAESARKALVEEF